MPISECMREEFYAYKKITHVMVRLMECLWFKYLFILFFFIFFLVFTEQQNTDYIHTYIHYK